MARIEAWLLEKFAGKLVARAAVAISTYVASKAVQGALVKAGVHGVQVDPIELSAGITALGHVVFEAYKHWRTSTAAAPAAPATASGS